VILLPNDRLYRGYLQQQAGSIPSQVGQRAEIEGLSVKEFEREYLLGKPLPKDGWSKLSPGQWAADRFWQSALHAGQKTRLSFPMIGRLVELLLRVNPMAREAIRLTYSHVFMDEFQDTTPVQYDLVGTIFRGTDTILTAVGDNKQQIMRWAMAMEDPFGAFERDFAAIRTPLHNNYRSSPDLVRIQHVLAKALDRRAVVPVSKSSGTISGDSCAIWDFSAPHKEARHLATFIAAEMKAHRLAPRDFVLLVRQKASDYANVLEPAFRAAGLSLRNEAGNVGPVVLQELLAEEVSQVLVSVLRLATTGRAGRHWSECLTTIVDLRGIEFEDEARQSDLARELDAFAIALHQDYPAPPQDQAVAVALVDAIINFVGRECLIAAHPAYAQGTWFSKVFEAAAIHLLASSENAGDWSSALDAYEGIRAVPLMTIHKSKGLEYHTVTFVGLDDGAWWSFAEDKVEGTAGFFVAFTRAKQRVIFTYCAARGARTKIATLYQLLQAAGVKTIEIA
jgi:superfamily I DNA/RNA helicase